MSIVNTDTFGWREGEPPAIKLRPRCPGCDKTMGVWRTDQPLKKDASDWEKQNHSGNPQTWKYRGYGYFCTLRCATDYANRIIESKIKQS